MDLQPLRDCYQQILRGVPISSLWDWYIRTIYQTYLPCAQFTSYLVGLQPAQQVRPLMPFPTMAWQSESVGGKPRDLRLKKMTPGIFSLLSHSRKLRKQRNVQNILCSFIDKTGQIVQLFSKAYFTNPFLSFMQILSQSLTVRVASSKPPGTRPMFYLCFINFFIFLWLTDCTPHNLRRTPTKGRFSMALLERVTISERGPFSQFMKERMLEESTPWGWNPKRHFSLGSMGSSYLTSKPLKAFLICMTLLRKSMYFLFFLMYLCRMMTSMQKMVTQQSRVMRAYMR